MSHIKKIILVRPRGFCAGVSRAVRAVEECLRVFGAPVYVKHQIVHNKTVVRDLEEKGAVTVVSVGEVPKGAVVVFSAHGSKPEEYAEAKQRELRVIDATCPLVTKVHLEACRYVKSGYDVVYIGHKGHIEGEGVRAEGKLLGKEIPIVETLEDIEKLQESVKPIAYLTQTTLSVSETQTLVEAIVKKFPHIEYPAIGDICYATTNRQQAVTELAKKVEVVLVVGSETSSNSKRLVETAREAGAVSYLVEDLSAVRSLSFEGVRAVGLTAGASAPEAVVQSIVDFFVAQGAEQEEFEAISENRHFADPLEMQKARSKK